MSEKTKLEELEAFKQTILEMEKESLGNINKTEDKLMVNKIIRLFEEKKNVNK